jgi:hypothetical protein
MSYKLRLIRKPAAAARFAVPKSLLLRADEGNQ